MRLIENASKEKLRGGFYTPEPIAKFILQWGINGAKNYDILEPSCGDGVFLEQLRANGFKYESVTAVEYDKHEAKKSEQIKLPKARVLNADFHVYCNETQNRFDLIVGNPPYIRYQYFEPQQQKEAEKIFTKASLKYSKLTNAWVSFVVGSSLLLKENGKIGFVIPAELLQVSYAKQLRKFLAQHYNKINIISFEKLVFPGIQQEIVLLLCEKNNSGSCTIEHLELKDINSLHKVDFGKLKSPAKNIDLHTNKWTFYFLEQKEIDFIEEISGNPQISLIGDFADVEVGITTGSNDFFTVPDSVVEEYRLRRYAYPLVGRSVQVISSIFNNRDWVENRKADARSYLLVFPTMEKLKKQKGVLDYLKQGKKLGIDNGYKTGIRDEWQTVPSTWISECLFIRRNNIYPKLILNRAKAYTTDTMHRVNLKPGTDINSFVSSYYNSLSFAFAEISGRSYGGGVLELMPSEVEKIVLPYNTNHHGLLQEIDSMFRMDKDINNILKHTNSIILKDGLGLSASDIDLANNIWRKLSSRRLNRSK